MADVYEKNLSQKSSLTTSDYIRVVGSDNVSYKQRVDNVADVFLHSVAKALPSSITDLNNITETSIYTIGASVPSNAPVTTGTWSAYVQTVKHSTAYIFQNYVFVNSSPTAEIYYRRLLNGTWTTWIKLPTRAEVDALSNKLQYYSIAGQASITLDYASATRTLVTLIGGVQSTRGQYIVAGYTSTLEWKAVLEATGATLAKSGTRSLTITNTSNYSMDICIIVFAGSVTQQ